MNEPLLQPLRPRLAAAGLSNGGPSPFATLQRLAIGPSVLEKADSLVTDAIGTPLAQPPAARRRRWRWQRSLAAEH